MYIVYDKTAKWDVEIAKLLIGDTEHNVVVTHRLCAFEKKMLVLTVRKNHKR